MPPLRPRALRLASLAGALLVTLASPARAQVEQRSMRLNVPAPAGQYFSVANKTGLQGTPSYTIEAWVFPTAYGNFPTIVGNNYWTSFWLGLNPTGHVRFYPRSGNLPGSDVETVEVVALNRWTHVAATYDAATGYAIFLDGVQVAAGTSILGSPGTSTDDLRIGADRETGVPDYFWRGWLDEVRLWSVRRTGDQIRQSMFQGVGRPFNQTGAYAGLRGNWDAQQSSAGLVFDFASGLAEPDNSAAAVNGALVDTPAPPVAYDVGQEFNGADNYAVLPMGDGFADGLTIEAWVAPTSRGTGSSTIVGRGGTSFWFGLDAAGRLRFSADRGLFAQSVGTVPLRRWSHVAVTYEDGLTRFLIDGRVDYVTKALSGSVGENGRPPYVGADDAETGPTSFFPGYLDEVRVTRGCLSVAQVRHDRFLGFAEEANPLPVADQHGALRARQRASFGAADPTPVFGSPARVVRSGALHVSRASADIAALPLEPFATSALGGTSTTLPEAYASSLVAADLDYPASPAITDVDVFVVAGSTDLSAVSLRVRSPLGTWVSLVAPATASGRDLHTVFDDASPLTLATGVAPYTDGVRPAAPLAAFNGETSGGTWRLEMSATGSTAVDVWGWGLSINHLPLDAPGPAAGRVALRSAGANPVRGSGGLAFDLTAEAEVELALVDLQGREVRALFAGRRGAGTHLFQWNAAGVAPGVYFARLRVDGRVAATLRLTVLE